MPEKEFNLPEDVLGRFGLIAECKRMREELDQARERIAELESATGHAEQQRSAAILRSLPIGLYIYRLEDPADDRTLRMIATNPAATEFTGVSMDDVLGKTLDENFPGLRAKGIPGIYAEVARTGNVVALEDIHYADDRVIAGAFSVSAFPLPEHCVGIAFQNITDRKRADEALQESEALYRNLIETTAAVAWEVDLASRRFSFISPQIETLSGFPPEDWVDFDFWVEKIHPEDREEAVNCCQAHAAKGLDHAFEYRMFTADGGLVWVRDTVSVIKCDGHPTALRGYFIDITESKAVEEEGRKLDHQLQQAQKLESLGVLAGGIAHDFNNILVGIIGNADLALLDLPADLPARSLVKEILDSGRQAAGLTNQMLAYSGKGRFVVEPLDLNEVVQDMSRLLRSSTNKKTDLRFELADDLRAIEADASQLQQIVLNLVTNAADAVQETGGLVTVKTREEEYKAGYPGKQELVSQVCPGETCVVLEVSDSGCGMNPETQAKIFDPFFTTKFTGRGLGLASVLGIVRGHKGGLRVESEPGRGTTFTVLFPAAERPAREAAEFLGEQAGSRGSGTILLVDDEELVRDVAGRTLERLGYSVLVAEDGVEALKVFREHKDEIVCVLLDLTMPRMGGEETLTELLKINPGVQVVLSSGYSEHELKGRLQGRGLAGFIQKPYEMALLRTKLSEILGDSSPTE